MGIIFKYIIQTLQHIYITKTKSKTIMYTIYDIGIPGPGLRQAHKYWGVKHVNGIPPPLDSSRSTTSIHWLCYYIIHIMLLSCLLYWVYIYQSWYNISVCYSYHDFLFLVLIDKLKLSLRKFYGRHHDLVNWWRISVSHGYIPFSVQCFVIIFWPL